MAESKSSASPPRRAVAAFAPIADALAGRRWFPLWAVVHHTGRKSGTEFATPVAVVPTVTKDVFLIGLPWGENTNWARNVVAAGGATITWKGAEHSATAPRVIGGVEAASLSKALFRPVVGRFPNAIVLRRS
jgi:deazaflavin-dependent oxidoreductase (nitroreductase family)